MEITSEMKRVKTAAKRAFQEIRGVEGVGLSDAATLVVYVRDEASTEAIPDTFEGFSVRKIVTGSVSATG